GFSPAIRQKKFHHKSLQHRFSLILRALQRIIVSRAVNKQKLRGTAMLHASGQAFPDDVDEDDDDDDDGRCPKPLECRVYSRAHLPAANERQKLQILSRLNVGCRERAEKRWGCLHSNTSTGDESPP